MAEDHVKLSDLIKHQQLDIDKIYSFVKDPFKSKYQLLINVRVKLGTPLVSKAFTGYSQTINDVYENSED